MKQLGLNGIVRVSNVQYNIRLEIPLIFGIIFRNEYQIKNIVTCKQRSEIIAYKNHPVFSKTMFEY